MAQTNLDQGVARAARASAAGYRIRGPDINDAAEIGRVHLAVWGQAYVGILPEDYLASLTVESNIARWQHLLASDEADRVDRLVGLAPDGSIVGLVAWGASRDDDPAAPSELHAIDILESHHGSCLADLLLSNSIGFVGAQMLWVLVVNERAQACYRRYGFVDEGTRQHHDLFNAELLLMTRD